LKKKDLNFVSKLLQEFGYSIEVNTTKIEPDDLVKHNNQLIEQNKETYFKIGLNISEHLKNLQQTTPSKSNPVIKKIHSNNTSTN